MLPVHHSYESTLNGRFRMSSDGQRSHDGITVDASLALPSGLLMGIRSADKLGVQWNPDADDGSEVLVGVLDEGVKALGPGLTFRTSVTARAAEVKADLLIMGEAVDPEDAHFALNALTITVRGA
jgi:hypothetical protein